MRTPNRYRSTVHTCAALAASVLLLFARVDAQPRIPSFGFGLILGEPTGVTLKGGLGGNNAWTVALGSSWFGNFTLQGEYLWAADVFSSSKVGLYFGVGGAIGFGRGKGIVVKGKEGEWYYREEKDKDATALGVRGVVGVNAMPFTAPVEFFFEVAPLVGLTPSTGLGWQGSIGLRYYL